MSKKQSGYVVIEAILVSLIMFCVIFGMIQLGLYFQARYIVKLASFKACRLNLGIQNQKKLEIAVQKIATYYCDLIRPKINGYRHKENTSVEILKNNSKELSIVVRYRYRLFLFPMAKRLGRYITIKSSTSLSKEPLT